MGHPKCTKELIADAVAYKKSGMSNKDMCACLGISEAAFYRWLQHPKSRNQVELIESLKKAEGEFYAALRSKVIKAGDRDWKAAAWMLERTRPEEYARPEVRMGREEAAASEAVPRFYFDPEEAR